MDPPQVRCEWPFPPVNWDNLGIILPPVSTGLRNAASNVSRTGESFFVKLFIIIMLLDAQGKTNDLHSVEAALLLGVQIAHCV
jgi:hypothetical protein